MKPVRRRSLRLRLAFWSSLSMILMAVGLMVTAGRSAWQQGQASVLARAIAEGEREGGTIQALFQARMQSLGALAAIWENQLHSNSFPGSPVSDSTLSALVLSSSEINAAYGMWPGMNEAGLPYSESYMLRAGVDRTKSSYDATTANDTSEAWFHIPIQENRAAILSPYVDRVEGKDILMVSAVTPLRDQARKAVGMLGVDLYLDNLQNTLDSAHTFDGQGRLAFIAPDGVVAGIGGQPQWQGVAVDSVSSTLAQLFHKGERGVAHANADTMYLLLPVRMEGSEDWTLAVLVPESFVHAPFDAMLRKILWVSLGILVFSLGVMTWLGKALTRPVADLAKAMEEIGSGKGNLTQRLQEDGQDEIAKASRAFNRFVESIQDLVLRIHGDSAQLRFQASGMKKLAGEAEASAIDNAESARDLTNAIDRLTDTLVRVGASSDQSRQGVESVADAVSHLAVSIGNIAQNGEAAHREAQQAVMAVDQATRQVQSLSAASAEIERVIEAIVEISEQTKLLALNATIEAARAGEAGKGFAVVAGEVKNLAKETADASEDIRRRIAVMQESAQGTAGEIQAIREVIGRVDSAVASIAISVEEQSRTTQGITHDLGAATASVRDTSGEILRAAESVDGIAAQVKQVQKRSELVRDIARQSAKRGEEVDKVAETLVDQLGNFNMSP